MSVHFHKKSRAKQEIPTASLPDIIFMLLIFFMVSTVLREVDLQVRVILPDAEAIQKIEQKRLVQQAFEGLDASDAAQASERPSTSPAE